MFDSEKINQLSRLYRVAEAGERGFATAAVSTVDPAVKAHLKSYAHRRALMQADLLREIRRLAPAYSPRSSIRGTIHRGTIVLVSGMTIEDKLRERTALNEAMRGETFALRAYQHALQSGLPDSLVEMLERHREEISEIRDELKLLSGLDGKRLWVRLFSNEKDAYRAIRQMNQTGIDGSDIERGRIGKTLPVYAGKRGMVNEAILSGSFFGFSWGLIFAAMVSAGMAIIHGVDPISPSGILQPILLVSLAMVLVHVLIGTLAGLILGTGAIEEDSNQYRHSVHESPIYLRAVTEPEQAVEF